jgi:hypothetical protein
MYLWRAELAEEWGDTQSPRGWSVDHLQRGLPREPRLRPRHQVRVPQLGQSPRGGVPSRQRLKIVFVSD